MATKKKPRVNVTPTGLPTQPGQVTPNYNVNKPFGPGIPRPSQPSIDLATLKYKDFLNGRGSTRDLGIQFAKLTKNADLLARLTGTGTTGSPAPAAPTAPVTGSPSPTPPSTVVPQVPAATTTTVPAGPGVGAALLAGRSKLPMPSTVPTIDPNALYGPAERMIAAQRAAALAAQDKAFKDNLAFEQFIQDSLTKGNTALAGTTEMLASTAAGSRRQSLANIDAALAGMKALSGGNSDLERLAGSTAATQSNQLMNAGQIAQNTIPDLVGQAGLRYAQDMRQVGGAQGRVMNDAAIRATQAALGDTAKDQVAIETAKAEAALKETQGQRDYIVEAAQLDALERFNAGKLTQDEYATQSKLFADLADIKTTRDVENLKAQTAAAAESGRMTRADAANLNKLALEQLRQTGQTNRKLLDIAKTGGAKTNDFTVKAVDDLNQLARNQTQEFSAMDRHKKGQFAKTAAHQIVTKYGANGSRPGGLKYSDLYNILAGIPGMNEVLGDPAFVAWLKQKLPPGAR